VTPLLTLQALSGLLGTTFISSLMDRFGRKPVMLAGLAGFSLTLLLMSSATKLSQWALLIPLYGILQPVFFIGSTTMVADLIVPENRTSAFALTRTLANIAIALGPAVGGHFIAQNHEIAYFATAAINLSLLLPVTLFITETLPKAQRGRGKAEQAGYRDILRDRRFIRFIGVFALLEIAAALVFNLLSVYASENFNIQADAFGQILAVNALMVIFVQYGVTQFTRRFRPMPMLAIGSLFYTVGLSGFALARTLPHFMGAMAVMTIGELMVAPTSNALVAQMAPPDKRARYMGLHSLTYTAGTGIGPAAGGLVSDAFGPAAIWFGGAATALLASFGFAVLDRQEIRRESTWAVYPAALAPSPLSEDPE
jgi:predicted MFS family arabinose efflux permease